MYCLEKIFSLRFCNFFLCSEKKSVKKRSWKSFMDYKFLEFQRRLAGSRKIHGKTFQGYIDDKSPGKSLQIGLNSCNSSSSWSMTKPFFNSWVKLVIVGIIRWNYSVLYLKNFLSFSCIDTQVWGFFVNASHVLRIIY